MRIEICGGIASGKTSLAKLLEEHNVGTVIYEDFKVNPFWEAFYNNPGEYIFETELTFTLQHYHEIKKRQYDDLIICDYSLLLDLAYANIGLNGNKLEIYYKVLKEIYKDIGYPDLYIYLECSADKELSRIKKRNRAVESNIELKFLKKLNSELLIDMNKQSNVSVLKINSEQYNFVNDLIAKKQILDNIKKKIKRL
jgi:deoxyadenosine/deoxycytidine kinase